MAFGVIKSGPKSTAERVSAGVSAVAAVRDAARKQQEDQFRLVCKGQADEAKGGG